MFQNPEIEHSKNGKMIMLYSYDTVLFVLPSEKLSTSVSLSSQSNSSQYEVPCDEEVKSFVIV